MKNSWWHLLPLLIIFIATTTTDADSNEATTLDATTVTAGDATTVTSGDISTDATTVTSGDISTDATTVTSGDISTDATTVTSGDISTDATTVTSGDIATDATDVTSGDSTDATAVTSGDSTDATAVTSGDSTDATDVTSGDSTDVITATFSMDNSTDSGTVDHMDNSTGAATADPSDDSTDYSYSYIAPSGPDLVRCYTCEDARSNEECIGERLGENGTMKACDLEFPQCVSEFKMNPAGDGYLIRKYCIDADECYDKMWDSVLDEFNAQCMGAMYTGNNATLGPERWCFFCCLFASEMDGCNKDGHMHRVPLPEENNWDPNMNWDYSMKSIEEENAAHTLTRSIVSVVFSSALYLALTSLL